jgi:putative ABC transport system permease protein
MNALAIAIRVVRLMARLVPRWRRADWEREWEAELEACAREVGEPGSALLAHSTGAVADAIYLRSHAMYLDLWWGDVRFAWRNAARRPGFTLLVVLTLALGLGVNSAVFALVDAVLLRPLPFRDPSRIVFIWQTLPEHNVFELEATPFDYAAWRTVNAFSFVALIDGDAYTLTGEDAPERVRGSRVTSSLMPLLGLAPQIGRGFTADEDRDSSAPVVILNDGLWRRRYGADAAILGRSIRVNGVPHTVVGVMPRGVSLPGPLAGNDDLWLPARMAPAERDNAISHNYSIVARLADGVSFARASAEIETFAARMAVEHRDSHKGIGARLVPIGEQTVRAIKPALLVVAGGVALLLLVAGANAVTLFMARAANRRHEIAVRAALGATASRLRSLAIAECLLFSALGGLAGLVLGGWSLRALLPVFAATLPASASIDVDGRAALFTAGLAVLLGLMFGVVVTAHQPDGVSEALKGSTRAIPSGSIGRTRHVLVVAQVTFAVILLSAAGLMLNSVGKLSRISTGFDADHVLTFKIALTGSNFTPAASRIAFVSDLLHRLKSTAGVRSAAVTSTIPFGGTRGANGVDIEGRPPVPGEPSIIVDQRQVAPDYFQTMRIPLLSGRAFTTSDDSQAERVTVINRTMAAMYWPNQNPIDRRARLTGGYDSDIWFRIVGVVDDVRHIALSRGAVAEMYRPYLQAPVPAFTVVVRTVDVPAAIAPVARATVLAIDSSLPIYDVRTMDDRIAASFAQTRGTTLLLLVTAALAAALATVAIYGSIWYSVTQRLPEIAIRLALGATRVSVFRRVVGRALSLGALGAVCGTLVAMAAGPLLQNLLFDTRTTDPATYALVVGGVLTLTAAASLIPAHRAMRVDPMTVLRN